MKLAPAWRPWVTSGTIATLILFPLLNALSVDNGYWLHWRSQDTAETLGAWLLLSLLVLSTRALPAALGRPHWVEAVHAFWLLIGGFFLMGAVVKTRSISEFALRHRAVSPWIAIALLVVFTALTFTALTGAVRRGERPFELAVLILSPMLLVFVFQVGNAEWRHRQPRHDGLVTGLSGMPESGHVRTNVRTVVLLFDELSPDHLYGRDALALDGLPALRKLIGESTVYAGAFLPGGETRLAIPALFSEPPPEVSSVPDDRRLDVRTIRSTTDRGWLLQALARHSNVAVFGWHLDYCTGVAAAADDCMAVSLYNARTLGNEFSFVHPLWTTLNLLPADLPFGPAKWTPAARLHAATSEVAMRWLRNRVANDRVDVIYAHVNLPHIPFLAADLNGLERFRVTPERYLAQLRRVDAFVAGAIEAIAASQAHGRPIRLVVLSDHNLRATTPASDHERVVFIVHPPGGSAPRRDERRAHAADLLSQWLAVDGLGGVRR